MRTFRGLLLVTGTLTATLLAPLAAQGATRRIGMSLDLDMNINGKSGKDVLTELPELISRLKAEGIDHVRLELGMKDTLDILTKDGSGQGIVNQGNLAYQFVKTLHDAHIDVIPVVGVGDTNSLPGNLDIDRDPKGYLTALGQNARDIVTAFALADFGIHEYQIENELNAAGMAGLMYKWRRGARWWDPNFKLDVLKTLSKAVKAADKAATVFTNFHDLISDPVGRFAVTRPPGLRAIANALQSIPLALVGSPHLRWWLKKFSELVDGVGINYYPNYVLPYWVTRILGLNEAKLLERKIAFYKRHSKKRARVTEAGYQTHSPFGHNAGGQYQFTIDVLHGSKDAESLTFYRGLDPKVAPPHGLERLNPERSVEPYFGYLNPDLTPKTARLLTWGSRKLGRARIPWLARKTVTTTDPIKTAKTAKTAAR